MVPVSLDHEIEELIEGILRHVGRACMLEQRYDIPLLRHLPARKDHARHAGAVDDHGVAEGISLEYRIRQDHEVVALPGV